jgi:molybdopterin converting factor small subunit
MRISVKYFGIVDLELPEFLVLLEDSTVGTIMDSLGDMKEEIYNATFLVNKEPADMKTILKDGDSLLILQVLGGG